jgi:hypothetical protein
MESLRDEPAYRYLDNWSDRAGNGNIDEGLLTAHLGGASGATGRLPRRVSALDEAGYSALLTFISVTINYRCCDKTA